MTRSTLLVIAKAPVSGRVKTRLCPPCTPAEAAFIAEGALMDTLRTVIDAPADRHVIALDGEPGPWLPNGFEVFAQRGADLDERLAAAFADVFATEPQPHHVVLVGMDTPQISAGDLASAQQLLINHEAVIGMAHDGGWWCIGLNTRNDDVFLGVPMSLDTTGEEQLRRLAQHGIEPALLRPLLDVDTFDDAIAVTKEINASQRQSVFANRVETVEGRLASDAANGASSR